MESLNRTLIAWTYRESNLIKIMDYQTGEEYSTFYGPTFVKERPGKRRIQYSDIYH